MTALSADRETARKENVLKRYPCGVDTIYKGSFVGIPADGYVEALVVAAGVNLRFAGVAYEQVVCASNGTKYVRVYTQGIFKFAASSITQAMVGQMMYAVDDQTFDDIPADGFAVPVGKLVEVESSTEGWIDIGAALGRPVEEIVEAVVIGDFTDNTGTATGYVDLATSLPAGAIPIGVKYIVTTGFTGDTTAVVQTGVSGDLDRFSSVTDQSVLAAATVGHGVAADACDGMNAAQTIRVTVTGGADFTSISAGAMTVIVYFIRT